MPEACGETTRIGRWFGSDIFTFVVVCNREKDHEGIHAVWTGSDLISWTSPKEAR